MSTNYYLHSTDFPEAVHINEEAARLARTTSFSYADWREALRLIGDRPGREELIRAAADTASIAQYGDPAEGVYGWTLPHTVGVLLAAMKAYGGE